jgi:hypothetical protein
MTFIDHSDSVVLWMAIFILSDVGFGLTVNVDWSVFIVCGLKEVPVLVFAWAILGFRQNDKRKSIVFKIGFPCFRVILVLFFLVLQK